MAQQGQNMEHEQGGDEGYQEWQNYEQQQDNGQQQQYQQQQEGDLGQNNHAPKPKPKIKHKNNGVRGLAQRKGEKRFWKWGLDYDPSIANPKKPTTELPPKKSKKEEDEKNCSIM